MAYCPLVQKIKPVKSRTDKDFFLGKFFNDAACPCLRRISFPWQILFACYFHHFHSFVNFSLTAVHACNFFFVEKLAWQALIQENLAKKNCQCLVVHKQIKLVREKLLEVTGLYCEKRSLFLAHTETHCFRNSIFKFAPGFTISYCFVILGFNILANGSMFGYP